MTSVHVEVVRSIRTVAFRISMNYILIGISIFSFIAIALIFFLEFGGVGFKIFRKKCPDCKSRNTEIEVYAGNPYDKRGKWETGRQCHSCGKFWYS